MVAQIIHLINSLDFLQVLKQQSEPSYYKISQFGTILMSYTLSKPWNNDI